MPLIGDDGAGQRATRGTTQRILGLIFYLCVLVYVVSQLIGELRAQRLSAESVHWAAVSGEITSSAQRSATAWRRNRTCTWAEICFRYAVDGTPHESCRPTFRKGGCGAAYAADQVAHYPVGARVTVFYDPGAPEEAVLVPGSWRPNNTVQTCLLLIALMTFMVAYVAWRLARPPEADAAIGDPPPDVPPQV
jgi:hypothetical protein